jgi:hypothetical protein
MRAVLLWEHDITRTGIDVWSWGKREKRTSRWYVFLRFLGGPGLLGAAAAVSFIAAAASMMPRSCSSRIDAALLEAISGGRTLYSRWVIYLDGLARTHYASYAYARALSTFPGDMLLKRYYKLLKSESFDPFPPSSAADCLQSALISLVHSG